MSYKDFSAALPEVLLQLPAVIENKKEVEEVETKEESVIEEEESADA